MFFFYFLKVTFKLLQFIGLIDTLLVDVAVNECVGIRIGDDSFKYHEA